MMVGGNRLPEQNIACAFEIMQSGALYVEAMVTRESYIRVRNEKVQSAMQQLTAELFNEGAG